jgi:hypothetical protein
MSSWLSKLACCAIVVLCCAVGIFGQQNNKKVTVTLVRWPYT